MLSKHRLQQLALRQSSTPSSASALLCGAMVAGVYYGSSDFVEGAIFIVAVEFEVLGYPSGASEDRIVLSGRGHAACTVTTRAIGTVIESRTGRKIAA